MPVSIDQLGYKKLSRIIFEWQDADRASLLSLFIVIEVCLHWFWCFYIWVRQDTYGQYVDLGLLYPMWLCVTLVGLFFWWLVGHLARIKNNDQLLHYWQIVLIVIYSLYMAGIILIMGHSSLVSGVSLVGGAMLGMMLVRRSYIWRAFLWQTSLIVVVTLVPYLGVHLPNLRNLAITSIPLDTYSYITYSETNTLENAINAARVDNRTLTWDTLFQMRRASAFFWRSTHMYLALPKALFMVYAFRTMLLILDDSKEEVLKHANQDVLTKLNNRRFGLTQMQKTIMATQPAQDYSVILLDLDWFKSINDSYGHEGGDHVLYEVAQVLKQVFNTKESVSRYGGEEFLIVLPNTEHRMAMKMAEQLRESIAQHMMTLDDGTTFQITASLGVYTLTYAELLRIKQEWKPTDANLAKDNWTIRNGGPFVNLRAHASVRSLQVNGYDQTKLRLDKRAALDLSQQHQALFASEICNGMISIADKALYKAKEHGRNQVASANDLMAEGIIPEPRYGA
ncbi:sensor domain-containing diguanylate cyclase [Psychrobacter urativorans]|uniref:diguanylate cyclase n=1 Tax=Psychrobacter urativorans TaxID=45610 RepID=A0A0M4TFQ2_9GAMM|nr:GGDEF domain-containing protein [Psychrobacter urativorans]ALF60141.1 diguanylate cyclase [Psychrobacter urativorans]